MEGEQRVRGMKKYGDENKKSVRGRERERERVLRKRYLEEVRLWRLQLGIDSPRSDFTEDKGVGEGGRGNYREVRG